MNRETLERSDIEKLLGEAERLLRSGDHTGAERLCRRVLERRAEHPQALHLLGTVAYHKGDVAQAEALGRRALAARPADPAYHYFLGNVLRALNRTEEAVQSFRAALRASPDFHPALNNLGNALRALKKDDEAAACYQRAIAVKPDYALAHYNLGNVHRDRKQHAQAIACYRKALAIQPDYFDALNNLGNSLKDADRLEEARETYEKALRIRPDSAEALNNMGNVLRDLNRLQEATGFFDKAIALAPDFAEPHFGGSLVLLALNDYERGWREYEWRFKSTEFPSYRWVFAEPEWHGEALEGRTILLHCEQGYGDNLQMLRYVPIVHAKGGRIVLELTAPLIPLARSLKCPIEQFVVVGKPRPRFDVRCSMMSIPHALGTTLETIPRDTPYVWADAARIEHWRDRLASGEPLRVGVVWAGNPRQPTEVKRGAGIEAYRALFAVPGIRWFSLQVGPRARDVDRLPSGLIVDLSKELTDFGETAAAIAHLDLVVTTDTAVAHLAGALARPVWVLLRWAPDWRWGLEGETNPWYPTMRIFRQAARDDWRAPVAAVRAELEALVRARTSGA